MAKAVKSCKRSVEREVMRDFLAAFVHFQMPLAYSRHYKAKFFFKKF